MQHGSSSNNSGNFFLRHPIETLSAVLMVLGIMVTLFFTTLGGLLVGLAVGLSFYDELKNYFLKVRGYVSNLGLYKTLMVIGTALYLLMATPVFLISVVIGFCIIILIRYLQKTPLE